MDSYILKSLVEEQLEYLVDARVLEHVRKLLVEPEPVFYEWDYGQLGEQHQCWTIMAANPYHIGIVYCETGFGPRTPWGLVFTGKGKSMGMDCSWFSNLLEAYFDGFADELPIWRVFREDKSGALHPLSDENSWDATWQHVFALRQADPKTRYHCSHSIVYKREIVVSCS